ncbi:MAG TPA: nucleoside triphosphate pyrophosphohydrolase [Candidatus Bathyarchaeia archaeon]|nr:nucleoside triphosphate pyrophosphohydrolase [Candidatus Bathyarchaeia archaeon]
MRRFKVRKLVRDKIEENILKRKSKVVSRRIENDEFLDELTKKLKEEADELNPHDLENAKHELADIQLVVDCLLKILQISKKELLAIQKKRIKEAGAFDQQIYIETVDLEDDDDWVAYYEKKFEEIK